jgi:hypothetical protein
MAEASPCGQPADPASPHVPAPIDAMDRKSVIGELHAILLRNGYWDDARPDLSGDSAHMMADCWEADGEIPVADIESPEFAAKLSQWLPQSYDAAMSRLAPLARQEWITAHRVIKVTEGWRPGDRGLGVHWTWNLAEWAGTVGAYAVWAPEGMVGHEIMIEARVPPTSVDWKRTLMANMDWASGECECELLLIAGSPVTVTSITRMEGDVPVLFGEGDLVA